MCKRIEHQMIDGVECKHCYKCGEWKLLSEFNKNKSIWDGLDKKCKKCQKEYNFEHREEKNINSQKWRDEHPKETRSNNQYNTYKYMDINNGFGDVIDFDAKWIVENIYTQKCAHCGETDWRKLGCNRLDNSKPHTKDNVEPCCLDCNVKLAAEYRKQILSIPVYQIDQKTGEIIKTWENAEIASEELKLNSSHIRSCCRGERKTHGGFIWKNSKKLLGGYVSQQLY